jgi:ketosteroid isomerase-like protein
VTDNADRVRQIYAGFERGDVGVLADVLAPDVQYVNPEYAIERGILYGKDAFRGAVQGLLDDFRWDSIELRRVQGLGDQVLVEFCTRGTGKMSGAPVAGDVGHVWSFREGQVARFQWFQTYDEAIAAVRGGESDDAALVRRLYELWQQGEQEEALASVDREIEWIDPPDSPESDTHVGPEGILFSTDRWLAGFEQWSMEVEEVRDLGDGKVLVQIRQRGRGRGSTVDIEAPVFHLWTISDGRAVRMQMFLHEPEALAAAHQSRPRDPA